MSIEILRRGSQGAAVRRWQHFLLGLRHPRKEVDGDFDLETETATKAFQRSKDLTADGIVGPFTLGAALTAGFDAGFRDPVDGPSDPVLVDEPVLRPIRSRDRKRMFGEFEFEAAPTAQNPEAIRILGDWQEQNIEMVTLPQLKGISVFGRPSSGRLRFHRKAIEQLKALWQAWETAGLSERIMTFEGSYIARFIRGSRTKLSNHSFGSAFDINARWNGLGAFPALEGQEGSVRELVDIANENGFFWGGHFSSRPDGMHFEVAKLLA